VLSILGLVLSTASAFWLLVQETRDRLARSKRLMQAADLRSQLKAKRDLVKERKQKLQEINTSFGRELYSSERDRITADILAEIETQENELDEMNDAHKEALEVMPPVSHFGAFILLAVGFLLQLVAELMKIPWR
jgi:hypothetical protein